MNEPLSLREWTGAGGLGIGLAATLGAFMPFDAEAQEAAAELPQLSVEGWDGRQPNTLNQGTGLSRLPGRVQDTPQAISVVPGEVIRQQNATTLEQALRNVPGITVSAGEGNGGLNGDQFRIRGFQAKNDIYLDGLRDFGVYARDAFNIGDVQVIKGPSSETFGLGTAGGAINTISKRALLSRLHRGRRHRRQRADGARHLRRQPPDRRDDGDPPQRHGPSPGHPGPRQRVVRPGGPRRLARLRHRHRHDLVPELPLPALRAHARLRRADRAPARATATPSRSPSSACRARPPTSVPPTATTPMSTSSPR